MGLNEEYNEQNQHTWLSRVARERQDLSASVSETLRSSTQAESSWSDDEEEGGFSAGYPFVPKSAFIPPRLGLQSRAIETVSAEDAISANLNSSAGVLSDEVEGRKPGATTQNTNMFLRFAQRLTASFGALNTNMQPIETQSAGQLAQTQPMDFGLKASALASIADIEVCTASTMTGSTMRAQQPSVHVTGSLLGENLPERQRLAGRTTRIRLEVVHDPDGKKTSASEEHTPATNAMRPRLMSEANTTGMRLPIMPTPQYDTGSTSVHLPALHARQDTMGLMSAHVSTVDTKTDTHPPEKESPVTLNPAKTPQEADLRVALSGTARFERGQREITIQNSAVTATSVVLVTLTTNPGPVVVQYISLQPHTSFTIHLTAPTTASALFNYIVLLAELF